MDIQKFLKVIIFLLIISLIFNFYSFSRIGQLSTNLEHLQRISWWDIERIRDDVNTINHRLYEISEEERWIVKEQFIPDTEKSSPESIYLTLDWTFREVEKGADVSLLYRSNGDTDWTEVVAKHNGGTNFSAPLELVSNKNYEYQFTAENNMIKTSDVKQIPDHMYKPMPIHTTGYGYGEDGSGNIIDFEADISFIEPPLFEFYEMKEAHLKAYKDNSLLEKTPFTPHSDYYLEEGNRWRATFKSFEENPTSIRIIVEYKDGTVHEGEIWPDDTFNYFAR